MKMRIRLALRLSFSATLLVDGTLRAQLPTTELLSLSTGGTQGNGYSAASELSPDGRFVAFVSLASNLVPGDSNACSDVFVRDRLSGTTERVSVDSAGAQGDLESSGPSISADGRFVAFVSSATNLVPGDTNGFMDVFVRDRQSGMTERVSVSTTGAEGSGFSSWPSISDDGRFVAFSGSALNLAPGAWSAPSHVFVRDRSSGTTELMSVSGTWHSASQYPQISGDGRFIALQRAADVFVRDRQTGAVELVNVSTSGAAANDQSFLSGISTDGRFVTFGSFATNLDAGDTNFATDGFVRDRLAATTERVTVATGGSEGDSDSYTGSISDDGRYVVFYSLATNLVAGDTNGWADGFVRDRQNGTTERVTLSVTGAEGDSDSYAWSMSADGRFVAFSGPASNLVAGDTNSSWDVFMRDRGVPQPAIYCTAGITSNGCSASIAANANPSLSLANSCVITVMNVEGQKPGILFYGVDNAGFSPAPWASGSTSWLCVKHPAQRTPVQNSGGTFGACDGSFALDWNAYQTAHPLALGNPWSVGAKVYAQAWFRDPLAAKGTNLSNALELTYLP